MVGHGWFPETVETLLKRWSKDGIITFGDITKQGIPLQKCDLEWKIHSKILWMHYFQLRAVLFSPALS